MSSGTITELTEISYRLHDLGKLAVPVQILEKPMKLTKDEFNIIKSHPYYTYRILETISGLDVFWEVGLLVRVDRNVKIRKNLQKTLDKYSGMFYEESKLRYLGK